MRNISDKSYRENQNTRCIFNNFFLNRSVYEIMWNNMIQPDSPQMTVVCMFIACWVTKATNTHSEYVLIVFAL